jgi:SAM-dependent methyltransferase
MNRLGFRALSHDLTDGPGPIAAEGPFDVIVAGELIEHVGSIDMLFQTARDLLSASGELVITTPNPWAPARVRAGQRGDVWENVDHILFAFPSGVAELAERHGLVLAEAATTSVLRAVRRRARGRQWLSVGFATQGTPRVVRVAPGLLRQLVGSLPLRDRRFVGGTFVYVVRRPSSDADPGR